MTIGGTTGMWGRIVFDSVVILVDKTVVEQKDSSFA